MSNTYSTFWRDIYHESIVEHDPRLRSICTLKPWIGFDEIIDVDRVAAKHDDRIASHPIAIFLNKLAPKSRACRRINKDGIYERPKQAFATEHGSFNFDRKTEFRDVMGIETCSKVTIDPRNLWLKLYERNPRFTPTISTYISTQLSMAMQARFTESVPDEINARCFVIPMNECLNSYKVRIYHPQSSNQLEEGGSFMLIWKERIHLD